MKILIFGATGSIGNTFFSILRKYKNNINVVGATCDKNIKKIKKLSEEFNIKNIGINNLKLAKRYEISNNTKVFKGINSFKKLINKDIDIIIFAISGLSALDLSMDVVKSGHTVGLANKECIISVGKSFMSVARKNKTKIVPLDSEHNSIYQLIKFTKLDFQSVTITASGGPFHKEDLSKLKNISPKEALSHPTWKMGKKITIDSATLMNKALEIIEAKYLFDLDLDQVKTVIHPESIIHATINFSNGSSASLMSEPNMEIPIINLLNVSKKIIKSEKTYDLSKKSPLNFFKIDVKKFPAIKFVYDVIKIGGIAPHVMNYNNEILVNLFLKEKIGFLDIVKFNELTLKKYFKENDNIQNPTLEDLISANKWIDLNIIIS